MSDSEGDFESADEDTGAGPTAPAAKPSSGEASDATTAPAAEANPEGSNAEAAVITSQPPTVTSTDTEPKVEMSYGGNSGGSWASWGMSWGQSFISGAKSGVSVIAKELGDGIDTVSRTVESVLEAPSPEEIATDAPAAAADSAQSAADTPAATTESAGAASAVAPGTPVDNSSSGGWLRSGWRVGGALTTSVTQTGSYLMTGGLDLLEALGKRTMDALQDTDPGFQRTKALLGRGRRPNLSELLREAQASGAAAVASADGADADADSPDFACQFERLNGSAYLDGLQTLAGQCELRLQAKLSAGPARQDLRPLMADILGRLERIREADVREEKPSVAAALTGLPGQFAPANAWLERAVADCLRCDDDAKAAEQQNEEKEEVASVVGVAALQVDCVRRLAGLTASTLHYLLKAASLTSAAAANASAAPPAESADRLADLCFALIGCADALRERACVRMQAAAAAEADEHAVNQAMTQAILEAEGSKAYLQDAFLLLAPVLQLAALDEPVPAAATIE